MKVITKDLLSVDKGIICHQCNCRGSMGAGIALAIKRKWPHVYDGYRKVFEEQGLKLASLHMVRITDELYVANMMCQDEYGGKRVNTNYNAVALAFSKLHKYKEENLKNSTIYIPYKMGCGLAGGNWKEYTRIVDTVCPGVIACKLR
jgi:O-acetyl-ADP-ribose deacetylase (regulator of RNase III)